MLFNKFIIQRISRQESPVLYLLLRVWRNVDHLDQESEASKWCRDLR